VTRSPGMKEREWTTTKFHMPSDNMAYMPDKNHNPLLFTTAAAAAAAAATTATATATTTTTTTTDSVGFSLALCTIHIYLHIGRTEERKGTGHQRLKYLDSLCASWKDNVSPTAHQGFRGQSALAIASHGRQCHL